MATNELAVQQQSQDLYIAPVVGLDDALDKFKTVRDYTAKCLVKDVDYGTVPGVSKPSLLKPGAEKIGSLFGLSPKFECIDRVLNFNGEGNPDNEPFFYFEYRCSLYKGDHFVGSCDASCNSWEKKYRYRKNNTEIRCPNCGKTGTIIKGKKEYGGGWVCYEKKGGCRAKFGDNDPVIISQLTGSKEVKNFDTAEQVNTFQKMAQKRAYVGAILIACNLSEYYTQDVEDMASFARETEAVPEIMEGEFTAMPPQESAPAPAAEKPKFDEKEFLRNYRHRADLPGMYINHAEKMPDQNGEPYGEKTTEKLFYMMNMIQKKIGTITDANTKEIYLQKMSAINEILTKRASQLQQEEMPKDPHINNENNVDDDDVPAWAQ